MADGTGVAATRLPMYRALAETSNNQIKVNTSMMPPPAGTAAKRKIPTPPSPQPDTKMTRSNPMAKSLLSLASQSNGNSGIARPSSAASSRHNTSRSIDLGLQKKASGIRPPPRMQASRMRPATSTGNYNSNVNGDGSSSSSNNISSSSSKGEAQSEPVINTFDIDSKMTDMTAILKNMADGMGSAFNEQSALKETMELYKRQVRELEEGRRLLEDHQASLRRELDETKSALSSANYEADDARRQHLNDVDGMRRKFMNELDEIRRKHRDEIDESRREHKHLLETATNSATENTQQLEKRHQAELESLRRELSWTLEEEQRARQRDIRALQGEAQTAQKLAEQGQERHSKDLHDKDERIDQLSKSLDREKDLSDSLRKQLNRSGEQNAELENTNRNLKAQVEFLKSDSKSQSQAFADLEQQTQDALIQTEDYKSQLRKEESLRRKLLNQIQDLKGNIRVFCRVRPPLAAEMGECAQISFPDANLDSRAIEVLGQEEKSSLGKVTTKTHAFNFDHSFGPGSQNADIFAELSELVAAVCGGSFNTCIFSYGQTGSGKTYTMASPDGMIARAVDQIFDTAHDLEGKGWRYTITGSFVEVYNENVNDLLGRPEDFDKKKHEIRHNVVTLTTEITDVTDVELQSSQHFTSVLEQALRNRSIAATKANERSSRSHSVCILRLSGHNSITGESCNSTLNLVDLAGSERLAHSQATGCRLKETQNINKSLSCLADVIAALGESRDGSHIPYRNSKLTYLLQNSLGGNSKTLMFVMISPLQEHLSETLSSLNFATKVNNTRIIRRQKK